MINSTTSRKGDVQPPATCAYPHLPIVLFVVAALSLGSVAPFSAASQLTNFTTDGSVLDRSERKIARNQIPFYAPLCVARIRPRPIPVWMVEDARLFPSTNANGDFNGSTAANPSTNSKMMLEGTASLSI